MNIKNRFRRGGTPQRRADALTHETAQIALRRLDRANGLPRPAGFGTSYVEQQYGHLAERQRLDMLADGEQATRPHRVTARRLDVKTAAEGFLLGDRERELVAAGDDYQHAVRVLTPYRRRTGGKWWYIALWVALVLGDVSGVWAAAVANGDIVWMAFGVALAAGLAAGAAGFVGAELRHVQMARIRRRHPESLSVDEQRYRNLFVGDAGTPVVKLVAVLSLTAMCLIAVAVYNLRAFVEGTATGLAFAALSLATALGSALLGYFAADEVADQIAVYARRVRRADRRYRKLAAAAAFRDRAQADETVNSLRAEYLLRAAAARQDVAAMCSRVQMQNPEIFGHGLPPAERGTDRLAIGQSQPQHATTRPRCGCGCGGVLLPLHTASSPIQPTT